MHLKNGVLIKGPPPKSKTAKNKGGPVFVPQVMHKTHTKKGGARLDALLKGEARILIYRRIGGLGDMAMATPIARAAKKKWPNCHVTYAVDMNFANGDLADLLRYIPYIDEVIDYKIVDRSDYDMFSDITSSAIAEEKPFIVPKSRIELFARDAGIPLDPNGNDPRAFIPIYVMTEEEDEYGKQFIKENIGDTSQYRGIIGIHTRSADNKKTWPEYRIREFTRLAHRNGYHCILFGWNDPQEWHLANITRVMNFKLRSAMAIMKQCSIVLCPDSYILHMAAAMNLKTVCLLGSQPPGCRVNHYPNAIGLVNPSVPCLGCMWKPCHNNVYCMSSITAEMVMKGIEKQLAKPLVELTDITNEEELVINAQPIRKNIKTFRI